MINEFRSHRVEYVMLLVMISLTSIAILDKDMSIFYILYLFWWDELLKSFFDLLNYLIKKSQLNNAKVYKSNLRGRFFFLVLYFLFIVIFFGVVIDANNKDLVYLNFELLFFQNAWFNLSLIGFLIRGIYFLNKGDKRSNGLNVLSKGIITLHVSIILGIFIWGLTKLKFQELEEYATLLAVIPFLLFKIFFEVLEIKASSKK